MKLTTVCMLLPLVFAGCGASSAPAYDPAGFTCELAIDSVSTGEEGRFTALYTSEGDTATMMLTAPTRLEGISFTFTEAGCTLRAGETAVPLSEQAAASLQSLADLLRAFPETASDRKRTAAGTVLTYPLGQVTLDDAGYPVLAETAEGRRASVRILLPETDTKSSKPEESS